MLRSIDALPPNDQRRRNATLPPSSGSPDLFRLATMLPPSSGSPDLPPLMAWSSSNASSKISLLCFAMLFPYLRDETILAPVLPGIRRQSARRCDGRHTSNFVWKSVSRAYWFDAGGRAIPSNYANERHCTLVLCPFLTVVRTAMRSAPAIRPARNPRPRIAALRKWPPLNRAS
jgi:hypothetical protein